MGTSLGHLCLPSLGLRAGPARLAPHLPLGLCPQVLFALCSLLRHFPYAQRQFLKLGGLQVLRSLVQEKGTEVLAVRVVTLLYDLVTEKVSAQAHPVSSCLLCVCFWVDGQTDGRDWGHHLFALCVLLDGWTDRQMEEIGDVREDVM